MQYFITAAIVVVLYMLWRWLAARKATFFTPQQEQAFLALVQGYFSERNIPARLENGAVHPQDDKARISSSV